MAEMLSGNNSGGDGSSVVQRQMNMPHRQIPSAEEEADHLSDGIRGTSPDAVLREMSSRLNADLSGVRFHSDISSEAQAEQMGARAWTSGRDIYFGKGGFEPRVAAHELVHTVQQGAERGSVRQSVAPGTVQMWSWWPFSKKKESKYDKEQGPADIADSLFRIQAGYTASEEGEKAERDAKYAKTYDRELKRLNKANREQDQDNEEENQKAARNAAEFSAINLRTKKRDYVSNEDKTNYNRKILTISKETYKELIDRLLQAAAELCDHFNEISRQTNESTDKNCYTAANSTSGKNFKLCNRLIQNVEQVHENDETFRRWKNELRRKNRIDMQQLARAELIINKGISSKNSYLKSDEGIRDRAKTDQDNKEFYKKIYKKKKTRLDRMAAVYKRNNNSRNDTPQPDLISEKNNNSDTPGMNESSDGILVEGLSEIDKEDTPGDEQSDSKNLIFNKSVRNDDDSSYGTIRAKKNNIISTNMNNDEEDSYSNSSLKSKVEDFASGHSDRNGMEEYNPPLISEQDLIDEGEDDDNEIIRNPGNAAAVLPDLFAPKIKMVSEVKERNKKGKFVGSIAKGLDNLGQLGLAVYNQNMLNSKNINTEYIHPAFSTATGGIGTLTGLAGTITGAADTWRNYRNAYAGGRRLDAASSGLDTLASLGNTVSSGLNVMKKLGGAPKVGEALANAGKFGGADMIPGLNAAAGGITLLTGAYKGIRGQKSVNTINSQIDKLGALNNEGLEEDQKKLGKIFHQGKRVAEIHRTSGAMKAAGGAITLGTGIALLSGPLAPVTAAVLGSASAAAGITNFVYSKRRKINLRRDITAEEMGFDNWADEIKKVKKAFPRENLSTAEAKEIILKSHGFDVRTRAEAFKRINLDRAKTLLNIAEGDGPLKSLAEKVIGALGVKRRKGRYAGGAQKLLAEKLGGS